MKVDLREIYGASTRAAAETAIDVFADKYGAKYDKAVACLTKENSARLRPSSTSPPSRPSRPRINAPKCSSRISSVARSCFDCLMGWCGLDHLRPSGRDRRRVEPADAHRRSGKGNRLRQGWVASLARRLRDRFAAAPGPDIAKRRILFPEPSWPSTSRSISRDASLPERNVPISSGDIAGIIWVLTDRNLFNR
jgi:hypothetical protein